VSNFLKKGNVTIQRNLTLIIVTICTISLVLAASLFTLLQLNDHRLSMVSSLTSEAKITAESVQASVLFGIKDDAETILSEFKNDPRIRTAAIYISKKELFASYNLTQENISVLYDFFDNELYKFENDFLHLYQPITIQGKGNVIGYIYLKASLDSIHQQLKNNILVTIIIVLSVLVVSVLLTSKLQKIISDPILELLKATNTIKQNKDYSIRVERGDCLEIQQLCDGFNSMLEEIQDRDEHLEHFAMYDELTSLPNKKYYLDTLNKAIAKGTRKSQRHAVIFLDLDRFKRVNDSLGHHVGDDLLKKVAERFKFAIRDDDFVARFGGDESMFLLQDITSSLQASEASDRIMEVLSEPFNVSNHDIVVTASIGISIYPENGMTSEELLKNADIAMYRSKKAGKNTRRFFTDTMNKEKQYRLELEEALQASLKTEDFILHYQPKVNLHSGEVLGMEALVRWNKNGNSLIPPNDFIPIAEKTGLIIPIGKKIIHQAVQQTKYWVDNNLLNGKVAINVSANQFRKGNFLHDLKSIINEFDLPTEHLEIEITEAVVMGDVEQAIDIMNEIKNYGITIAMDDFGTGYSSLSYLKKFPIDTLKIDMSFIKDMQLSETNMSIVRTIIDLAHTLKLDVVAEGVETELQATLLREMGCDLMQGYLFSRPLDTDGLSKLLEKNSKFIFK